MSVSERSTPGVAGPPEAGGAPGVGAGDPPVPADGSPGGVTPAELAELVGLVRRFGDEVVAPRALALDRGDADALARCWQGVVDLGLDRCTVPGADGVPMLTGGTAAVLVEQLAGADAGLAMLVLLANVGQAELAASGRAAAGGEPPAANAPPVPGGRAGSGGPDAVRGSGPVPRVSAVVVPDGGIGTEGLRPELRDGRVTGVVPFALGATGAATLVLVAREAGEPALVAVDVEPPGVTVRPFRDQLGLRSAGAAEIVLAAAPGRRLGGEPAVARVSQLVHVGVAAIARGVARRARARALAYAEQRYQGGTMIIDHGAVRDMLARMTERELAVSGGGVPAGPAGLPSEEEGGRAGDPPAALAAALAAKAATTDAAVDTTTDAVQVFGGMGYMHGTGVEKLMRDARYCQLYPCPNWQVRDRLLELQRAAAPRPDG